MDESERLGAGDAPPGGNAGVCAGELYIRQTAGLAGCIVIQEWRGYRDQGRVRRSGPALRQLLQRAGLLLRHFEEIRHVRRNEAQGHFTIAQAGKTNFTFFDTQLK